MASVASRLSKLCMIFAALSLFLPPARAVFADWQVYISNITAACAVTSTSSSSSVSGRSLGALVINDTHARIINVSSSTSESEAVQRGNVLLETKLDASCWGIYALHPLFYNSSFSPDGYRTFLAVNAIGLHLVMIQDAFISCDLLQAVASDDKIRVIPLAPYCAMALGGRRNNTFFIATTNSSALLALSDDVPSVSQFVFVSSASPPADQLQWTAQVVSGACAVAFASPHERNVMELIIVNDSSQTNNSSVRQVLNVRSMSAYLPGMSPGATFSPSPASAIYVVLNSTSVCMINDVSRAPIVSCARTASLTGMKNIRDFRIAMFPFFDGFVTVLAADAVTNEISGFAWNQSELSLSVLEPHVLPDLRLPCQITYIFENAFLGVATLTCDEQLVFFPIVDIFLDLPSPYVINATDVNSRGSLPDLAGSPLRLIYSKQEPFMPNSQQSDRSYPIEFPIIGANTMLNLTQLVPRANFSIIPPGMFTWGTNFPILACFGDAEKYVYVITENTVEHLDLSATEFIGLFPLTVESFVSDQFQNRLYACSGASIYAYDFENMTVLWQKALSNATTCSSVDELLLSEDGDYLFYNLSRLEMPLGRNVSVDDGAQRDNFQDNPSPRCGGK